MKVNGPRPGGKYAKEQPPRQGYRVSILYGAFPGQAKVTSRARVVFPFGNNPTTTRELDTRPATEAGCFCVCVSGRTPTKKLTFK